MEKSLSHYLIVTDIDDTLLPHDGEIPKRNLKRSTVFSKRAENLLLQLVVRIIIVQNYTKHLESMFLLHKTMAHTFMTVQQKL